MAKTLPYRVHTASGNQFDLEFPLHEDTQSPVRVSQLLSALLETLDRELGLLGDVGNGDVLQSVAMALAVRTRILASQSNAIDKAVKSLLESALEAECRASDGNVPPDEPKSLH